MVTVSNQFSHWVPNLYTIVSLCESTFRCWNTARTCKHTHMQALMLLLQLWMHSTVYARDGFKIGMLQLHAVLLAASIF